MKSYRQLPVIYYQIQTKFRDEIRPRFGVMRSREFIMKDAYSFHLDESCLEKTYRRMYDAYAAVCTRMGLRFRAVEADTGAIGGVITSYSIHYTKLYETMLLTEGYTNVSSLKGGFGGWVEAGFPVAEYAAP